MKRISVVLVLAIYVVALSGVEVMRPASGTVPASASFASTPCPFTIGKDLREGRDALRVFIEDAVGEEDDPSTPGIKESANHPRVL